MLLPLSVQTEMLEEAFPGLKAPISAKEIADFVLDFALTGHKYFNGKILPVSCNTLRRYLIQHLFQLIPGKSKKVIKLLNQSP